MNKTSGVIWTVVRRLSAVGLLALAGCASTLDAQVTSYQQWPVDAAGARYQIVPMAEQQNNLQFQFYADMIRANIGPTGLVEAQASEDARFELILNYSNPITKGWSQSYNDGYIGGGWGFNPFFGIYQGGYGGGWGSGISMGPSSVSVPVDIYKNTLSIIIKDKQQKGAEVYRSSAVNVSSSNSLADVMPYLAQAVFDDFPGNNGQVREVRYPRSR